MKKLKPYSVLLLYPDYIADGTETFYDFVKAGSPAHAVLLARKNAVKANELEAKEGDDFAVLLVLEGNRKGLDPEATK